MMNSVETLAGLERRIQLTVSLDAIEREVDARLQRLARQVKLPGFRPGKVPMKMVAQMHGASVQSEVLGDAVSKAFGEAVTANNLRVAGQPRIEPVEAAQGSEGQAERTVAFNANFEVFPEIADLDLKSITIERPVAQVGDTEIDKTLDILRKQRVTYQTVERAAQADDRLTIDFVGRIDGVEFEGGKASDFVFNLGQGRMLSEFEAAVAGLSAGGSKTFPLSFPADYHGKDVAGKTAEFTIDLKLVEEPILPVVDAEFAKSLGIEDGDLEKMRADIRANLEREVRQRIKARAKQQVMDALANAYAFDVPSALVESESERMAQQMREEMKRQGMQDTDKLPVPLESIKEPATRRVRLGLGVGELVAKNNLNATPGQVKALIEDMASAYERPQEFVRWYYSDKNRMAEAEAVTIEDNVVQFVLSNAVVTDKAITLDELMGGPAPN